jgi:hypothetical protein
MSKRCRAHSASPFQGNAFSAIVSRTLMARTDVAP